MLIFAIDDEPIALTVLHNAIAEAVPEARIMDFPLGTDALEAIQGRGLHPDVVFSDIRMPQLDGLALAARIRSASPATKLVFVTAHTKYAIDAMYLHASGYILKPAETDRMKEELDDLRHPVGKNSHKRVFAQTFGNFEFFVDGKPVAFKYSRTKEIIALLINNRGAQTTNGEIIASLWEDDGDPEKKGSYLSNLRQDLQNTMTRFKLTGIILKQRGSMAIATDAIECDLYDWLEKKRDSKYSYLGDYMNQYSWAEYVHAELDEISYAMEDE